MKATQGIIAYYALRTKATHGVSAVFLFFLFTKLKGWTNLRNTRLESRVPESGKRKTHREKEDFFRESIC